VNCRAGASGRERGAERAAELGLFEVGFAEVGFAEVGFAEVGFADVGLCEVGLCEVGLAEVGLAETGLADAGLAEVGLAETGLAETGPSALAASPLEGAAAGAGAWAISTRSTRGMPVGGVGGTPRPRERSRRPQSWQNVRLSAFSRPQTSQITSPERTAEPVSSQGPERRSSMETSSPSDLAP
jgi:hypothetical protein